MGFAGAPENCLLVEDYSVGLVPCWGEGRLKAAALCSATSRAVSKRELTNYSVSV